MNGRLYRRQRYASCTVYRRNGFQNDISSPAARRLWSVTLSVMRVKPPQFLLQPAAVLGWQNSHQRKPLTWALEFGVFQDSCHSLFKNQAAFITPSTGALSGLSVTAPTASQFLISVDQRIGFLSFAASSTFLRLAKIAPSCSA